MTLSCLSWRLCKWSITPAAAAQVTLLMDAAGTKELEDLPAYKELLQFFITPEVRCPAAKHALKYVVFSIYAVATLVCFKPGANPRSACMCVKEGCGAVASPAW